MSGPEARVRLSLVLGFYGACAALAFLWAALAGRPWLVVDPGRASAIRALAGAGLGLAGGLAAVALSRWLLARASWARELFAWFASLLGPISRREAALYALASGIGEELLFRGAIQPTLGLALTSALFALLHVPPRPRLLPWTVFAGVLGLGLGALARWSGDLGGAILAHFTVNALNLAAVGRLSREAQRSAGALPAGAEGQKLPGPDPAPSMGVDLAPEPGNDHATTSDQPPAHRAAGDGGDDPGRRG